MNISILGTGWLGLPLAKKLKEEHVVKGSVTSQEKIQPLRDAEITPYQIKIFTEGVQGDLTSFLAHAELLIIDIPPGLRSDPQADFVGKIGRIVDYIEKSPVGKVIFVSSTSVYKDQETFPEYTEENEANGTSEAAKQLNAAEKILLKNEHFQTAVVRFGGLIGPDRHPVHYLANKTGIKNPKAPVNLIQQEDCIKIINQIIKKEAWGKIFNAAYPGHPTREEYYSKTAKERNLNIPDFEQNGVSKGKKISSVNLKEVLGFDFERTI
ncbi:NAD(P)H-binding protein [Salegentibacter mishustinae]|uniref:Epimerase n=1 Tax=Salegentibacter mishustinae TaxID=270918 RepID=A0A0Q9Z4Y4_9FLAO|nr:NAD(P)H-binding protein [Salegentibacter mishustinae]KRG27856.1 epimerase [Salegentibacter mishustinae]PNW20924.1 NAD(P)-dependent oxidoreductase [Salegentibacter mishustinae]PZX64059.1 nucleoside-diphosphate-sugar epimerase [Salegentibacter mishustinae]GGW89888.1 epimerase [Salegentibacter mishustinae]